jgi:hypothetical protein
LDLPFQNCILHVQQLLYFLERKKRCVARECKSSRFQGFSLIMWRLTWENLQASEVATNKKFISGQIPREITFCWLIIARSKHQDLPTKQCLRILSWLLVDVVRFIDRSFHLMSSRINFARLLFCLFKCHTYARVNGYFLNVKSKRLQQNMTIF